MELKLNLKEKNVRVMFSPFLNFWSYHFTRFAPNCVEIYHYQPVEK